MLNGTIIKLQTAVEPHSSKENVRIKKLVSSIGPLDFIKLLRRADNKVNPRSAKKNSITDGIQETLQSTPELFWLKSKGILLATENCEFFERNRIRISLENTDHEGIMDGGHNTLAIAMFIASKLFDKKFSTWAECKQFWDANYDEIVEAFEGNSSDFPSFSIPIEILFPGDEDGALDEYYDYIAEICSARNNNVQLNETAKGNKVGLYDDLKQALNGQFEVIWKSGEAGKIKSEEVISMASIPLSFLQERGCLPDDVNQFNIVNVYSQKSKCVDFFNSVLGNTSISSKNQGKHILEDSYVSSGLKMVSDIMLFFDKLFAEFPYMYNSVSPGFGRIKSVDDKKSKLSIFRTRTSDYTYPPGFVYPLLTGVMELIHIDEQQESLSWKVEPLTIDLSELEMEQYVNGIKIANYDPQTVGKQQLFYQQARSIFETYLRNKMK